MLPESKFDEIFESISRVVAQRTSRRSFLGKVGIFATGTMLIPLLPMDRRGSKAHATGLSGFHPQTHDYTECNYWRHCSLDGYLCDCCGGGLTDCPPGTGLSPSSWVSSCYNPDDHKEYLIAYRDCCGKNICKRCGCFNTVGELPVYRPEFSNDIIWCFGAENEPTTYHCTISPIVGLTEKHN